MDAEHQAAAQALGLELHDCERRETTAYHVTSKGRSVGWIALRERDRKPLWDIQCDHGLNEHLGLFRSFGAAIRTLADVRAACDLIDACRYNARQGKIGD